MNLGGIIEYSTKTNPHMLTGTIVPRSDELVLTGVDVANACNHGRRAFDQLVDQIATWYQNQQLLDDQNRTVICYTRHEQEDAYVLTTNLATFTVMGIIDSTHLIDSVTKKDLENLF
jgi:hypothetical protein